MRRNRTKGDNEANRTCIPPTVAPIRATDINKGMFMLKTELSASHICFPTKVATVDQK